MTDAKSEGSGLDAQHDVDESLYSRQLYVYGKEAQRKMQKTNVLLVRAAYTCTRTSTLCEFGSRVPPEADGYCRVYIVLS